MNTAGSSALSYSTNVRFSGLANPPEQVSTGAFNNSAGFSAHLTPTIDSGKTDDLQLPPVDTSVSNPPVGLSASFGGSSGGLSSNPFGGSSVGAVSNPPVGLSASFGGSSGGLSSNPFGGSSVGAVSNPPVGLSASFGGSSVGAVSNPPVGLSASFGGSSGGLSSNPPMGLSAQVSPFVLPSQGLFAPMRNFGAAPSGLNSQNQDPGFWNTGDEIGVIPVAFRPSMKYSFVVLAGSRLL